MKNVLARLQRDLEAMCDETMAGLRDHHPDLLRRLPPELVAAAVRGTHQRAIDLIGGGATETTASRAEAVEFGRRAAHLGAQPDDVMAGYRVGADVANERVRAVLLEQQAPTETVLALWAWSTSFFDQLADQTALGVRRETVAQHGRRARARQALVDALLDGAPVPSGDAAGWTPPAELVAVVARGGDLEPPEEQGVVGRREGRLVALCGAQAPWLSSPGAPVAVGPVVTLANARTSWLAAESLISVAERLRAPGGDALVLRADDHLVDLVLAGNPWARQTLVHRSLGPLDEAPARSRALLEETLRAWLDDPGRPQAIAAALHLHPQTVHYRLRRLRAVMGDGLDDPQVRLAMSLALRLSPPTPG